MNASFVYRLALAFVLVPLGGCADPNIRDRWVRDYRVPPERAPTPVAPVRPTDRPSRYGSSGTETRLWCPRHEP
jgi:hypothetical protein